MKKFANLFIAGLALFAFTSCGGGTNNNVESAPAVKENTTVVKETADTNAVELDTITHDHNHDHSHDHSH